MNEREARDSRRRKLSSENAPSEAHGNGPRWRRMNKQHEKKSGDEGGRGGTRTTNDAGVT